ncbi:MAG: 2,3-bisphosphoglycerate-independent phosphoglycerate mutase [Alphaproteobacteria bacterium]|nr:MAG: 2,3-bisphosphoglycerate-independent phosphoglycerate mutase [Alphaproteobacteria bacterium]
MLELKRPCPVVLCILDGWGHRAETINNAVAQAATPIFDRLWKTCPHSLLDASERHVGLPEGQIGNSEVGHMNIGAGRVVYQDLPMIDLAIAANELSSKPALIDMITALKASGGTCHIMGLASPGGVHAHQDHMVALARVMSNAGIPVAVHAFLDGRDVPPRSARTQIARFAKDLAPLPGVHLSTLCGRYYAMDRDNRWDRVTRAYDMLVDAKGQAAPDALSAIDASYATDKGDEFVEPVVLPGYVGMKDGDGLIMANFRSDRARQMLSALLDPAFADFPRGRVVRFAAVAGMVSYSKAHDKLLPALFPPKQIEDSLGEVVSKAGLRQLRLAETEKYAHVTFFFNGGQEKVYEGEERILIPSPKVATYDLQPEMSAQTVADEAVRSIESGTFDLIVINFANPDMVGHTGMLMAAQKAVEAIDHCVGRIEQALHQKDGAMFITADHGNCETMIDPETGQPHTAHTLNRVPAILVGAPSRVVGLKDGKLADIAPTLLKLMGMNPPPAMTGTNLLVEG